jgi:predicted transcriptional regulator
MADTNRNKKMSDDEILDLVDNAYERTGKPFTTATEIAEKFDVTRQAVHSRLETMRQNGEVEKYLPARTAIYWTEPYEYPPEESD